MLDKDSSQRCLLPGALLRLTHVNSQGNATSWNRRALRNGEPDRSDDELAIRHAALDYDDNDYLVMTGLTRNAL